MSDIENPDKERYVSSTDTSRHESGERTERALALQASFDRVAAELRNLGTKHDRLLQAAYLEPSRLAQQVQGISDGLQQRLEATRQGFGETPKTSEYFLDWLVRHANGTVLTHLLRLEHFIRDYCGYPAIKDDSEIQSLREDGQKIVQETERLFEMIGQMGVKFHKVDFLKEVQTLSPEKYYENSGVPVIRGVAKENTAFKENIVWKERELNGLVADASAWGYESAEFPALNSKTNLWCWRA